MEIAAVAVSATDLSRAVAFYEQLGFRFPALEPDTQHAEAEAGVRLMIDRASLLEELHGEVPRPGNTAGFALLFGSPSEVDDAVGRVSAAGHAVVHEPFDAPWGQRYATVADPDGYRVDLFCPLAAQSW
jgi:predicted enzyme related to lactoylglutathione lyase